MTVDIVTGGAGFIGSHLVDRLLRDPSRNVRVLDNFSTGSKRNLAHHLQDSRLEIVETDISMSAGDDSLFAGAERVFHLAALADIVPSIQNPESYFRSNVEGTFRVLQRARAAGIKRLVYAASSSCYGFPEEFPTPETAAIQPQYPYALTKYLGEELVLHWAKVYKIPAVSLRFFNVFGPRSRTSGAYGAVFGVFLAQMMAGKELTIVGDGTQTRDFTFVTDIVDAILAAAQADVSGQVYNVGSGGTYSINHLVELLGAKKAAHIPKRPGEPDCTWADITKIRRDLGWVPKISFEQGVKMMLANIEHWKDAPVWTPESIAHVTQDWFKYLGA
jgi:UDP-glucose 4-epimerase